MAGAADFQFIPRKNDEKRGTKTRGFGCLPEQQFAPHIDMFCDDDDIVVDGLVLVHCAANPKSTLIARLQPGRGRSYVKCFLAAYCQGIICRWGGGE